MITHLHDNTFKVGSISLRAAYSTPEDPQRDAERLFKALESPSDLMKWLEEHYPADAFQLEAPRAVEDWEVWVVALTLPEELAFHFKMRWHRKKTVEVHRPLLMTF
jgi:hypothetical protein